MAVTAQTYVITQVHVQVFDSCCQKPIEDLYESQGYACTSDSCMPVKLQVSEITLHYMHCIQ